MAQVEYVLFSQSLVSYIGELCLLQFAPDQGVQCVAEEWLVTCVDILHSLWIREKGWWVPHARVWVGGVVGTTCLCVGVRGGGYHMLMCGWEGSSVVGHVCQPLVL